MEGAIRFRGLPFPNNTGVETVGSYRSNGRNFPANTSPETLYISGTNFGITKTNNTGTGSVLDTDIADNFNIWGATITYITY